MKTIQLLLLLMHSYISQAQPPSVNINLSPNPNANTAQWGTGSNVFIISTNGNYCGFDNSTILVNIKSGGSVICGGNNPSMAQPTNIIVSASACNTSKSWIGSAAKGLLGQECILPSGTYDLCVYIYGSYNGQEKRLLTEKCYPFNIAEKQDAICAAPTNITPTDGKTFNYADVGSVITFNWSPAVSSAFKKPITYQLQVWEMEEGQTISQAIYSGILIIDKEVKGRTSHIATPGTFEKRNASYVWRVTALDDEGKPLCQTPRSQPTVFHVKDKPKNVNRNGCIDFENDDNTTLATNWYSFSVESVVLNTDPGDTYNNTQALQLTDDSGPSIAINQNQFSGNWLTKAQDGCLCFDYKVDWSAQDGSNAGSFPKVGIFTGAGSLSSAAAYNASTRAVFVGNASNPLLVDDKWGKYCLPVSKCVGGNLPSNSFGQWQVYNGATLLTGAAACTAWDNLIQNVTGLVLPTDYNANPSEIVYFDNFCFACEALPPPPTSKCCSNIIDDKGQTTNVVSNVFNITQKFNIAPLNIKKLTTEIISIEDNVTDTSCMKCTAHDAWDYQFIAHNTAAWNSATAYNGSPTSASSYYPSQAIEWHCNKQGNLEFKFKISLPGNKAGCTRSGKICIRYAFEDINCITCEKIVCYQFNY
jgi:hypothetical protein